MIFYFVVGDSETNWTTHFCYLKYGVDYYNKDCFYDCNYGKPGCSQPHCTFLELDVEQVWSGAGPILHHHCHLFDASDSFYAAYCPLMQIVAFYFLLNTFLDILKGDSQLDFVARKIIADSLAEYRGFDIGQKFCDYYEDDFDETFLTLWVPKVAKCWMIFQCVH